MDIKRLLFKSHFLLGSIFTISMIYLTYYSYTVDYNSFLSSELVEIKGKIKDAYASEYTISSGSLLVLILYNDTIQYHSASPYASKYKYKSKTLDYLPESTEVILTLEKEDAISPPKQNVITKQYWKNIVGLKTRNDIHLSPNDYKEWYVENWKTGTWMGPILTAVGLCILYFIIDKIKIKTK